MKKHRMNSSGAASIRAAWSSKPNAL
uniref:Uncharacterized protein n=1 Tax=Arundo donax TaxID=35708 RepID=A0A0A9HE89_ARUDO